MEDLIPSDPPFPVCPEIEDLRNQGAFQKDFRLLLPSDVIESEQRFSEILQIEYQRYHGKSQTVELETGEKQNRKEELFLYPFQHNNASTIRKILERDSYCRKRKQWPLIP